jgi:hypothetical protein
MQLTTAPIASGAGSAQERFTFRGNVTASRHGWLRLTPAYSVHLVRELAEQRLDGAGPVLDPFGGTGTTLVTCAQLGIECAGVDLNPFLVWLMNAKLARYSARDRERARLLVQNMARIARTARSRLAWAPDLHQIEKWWARSALAALSQSFAVLDSSRKTAGPRATDLASLCFCRALIQTAKVSFGHQSMSFRKGVLTPPKARDVADALEQCCSEITISAAEALPGKACRAVLGDARELERAWPARKFAAVLTSPPYPNRMSYVRELRPYMYWLKYLHDGRQAGELDWRIIGGTWGVATSRLTRWESTAVEDEALAKVAAEIGERSAILGRYVRKYFHDLERHVDSITQITAPSAKLLYVIGNSKFYDVLLPAEQLLARAFERRGFAHVAVDVLRKRTSKPELYEYIVSAQRA